MKLLSPKRKTETTPKKKKTPRDAAGWCEEALLAGEKEDWSRAVVCYRRALQLAPFCGNARKGLEIALEEQILATLSQKELRALMDKPGAVTRDDLVNSYLDRELGEGWDSDEKVSDNWEEYIEDEDEAEEEEKSFLGKITLPDRIRAPRAPGFLNTINWRPIIAVGGALMITGTLFITATAISGSMGNIFSSERLPSITQDKLPADLVTKLQEADMLLKSDDHEEALDILRDSYEEFPDFQDYVAVSLEDALRSRGQQMMESDKFKEATEYYIEAAEVVGNNPLNWIDLGNALRRHATSGAVGNDVQKKRDVLEKAEGAFKQALALSPDDLDALFGLSKTYAASNKRKDAEDILEKLEKLDTNGTYGNLARIDLAQLRRR